MGKRAGGVAGIPGMDNEIYFVPEVAKIMIDKIAHHFPKYPDRILDACAGKGVLGEAIYNWYRKRGELIGINYQDIAYKEECDKKIGGSILDYHPGFKYNIIICNPPFHPVDIAFNIWKHLMSLLYPGGLLIFIIDSTYIYQGWQRAIELKYEKTYFLPRYVFDFGNNKKKKLIKTKGKSNVVLMDISVMICPEGYKENNFIYIPRDVYNARLF